MCVEVSQRRGAGGLWSSSVFGVNLESCFSYFSLMVYIYLGVFPTVGSNLI